MCSDLREKNQEKKKSQKVKEKKGKERRKKERRVSCQSGLVCFNELNGLNTVRFGGCLCVQF